jgi:hypothetical protein
MPNLQHLSCGQNVHLLPACGMPPLLRSLTITANSQAEGKILGKALSPLSNLSRLHLVWDGPNGEDGPFWESILQILPDSLAFLTLDSFGPKSQTMYQQLAILLERSDPVWLPGLQNLRTHQMCEKPAVFRKRVKVACAKRSIIFFAD